MPDRHLTTPSPARPAGAAGAPRRRPGGRRARRRALSIAWALAAALAPSAPASAPEPSAAERLVLSDEISVHVRRGRDLELEVRVDDGADWSDLALRFTGSRSADKALVAWNRGGDLSGRDSVFLPLELLSDTWRGVVLINLFPEDRLDGGDWIHVAGRGRLPTVGAGMWQVAEWFTGRGDNFVALMRANGLSSPELVAGREIRVPAELVHRSLRVAATSDDGLLVYGADDLGPYAGYRLRPGEALYSAVVVRFTARMSAEDVVTLADAIARRSGIADPTDIPVGYLVKIPLDELDAKYLPEGHPRRIAAEREREQRAESLEQAPVPTATGLRGVVVVIDPGHGGKDLGTQNNGLWEHDYIYDVAVRLKALLERHSAARVHMTVKDLETGWTPSTTDRLSKNLKGSILTDPPFLATRDGDAKTGVNLRYYLANSIYRKEVAAGADRDRIVFLSLHADALHPSLRGAMAYVPGASLRDRTYHHSGRRYDRYAEVREKPTLKFSYTNRIRSEAVSRKLADAILEGFRAERLPVHADRPVRDRIHRGKSTYVPAVIRVNEIPAKVLVETVNLGNTEDAALLGRIVDRERMARALVRGLYAHFGEPPPESLSRP